MPRKKKDQVPDWYRRLSLVYLEPVVPRTIGVYCLFFGDHFYIGKSVDIRRRMSWHLEKINKALIDIRHGHDPKVNGSYPIIIKHLIDNKDIVSMDCIVVDICGTENDALCEESYWLGTLVSHVLNYKCLNKIEFLTEYIASWMFTLPEGAILVP